MSRSYITETDQCPWRKCGCSCYIGKIRHFPGSHYEPPDDELIDESCNYEPNTDQLKRMLYAFNGGLKPTHKDYKSEIHQFCPMEVHDAEFLLSSCEAVKMIKNGVDMECWMEEIDKDIYDDEEWADINTAYLEFKLSHLK